MIFPIDELNALAVRITRHFDEHGRIKSRRDCEDIIDELLDLYLLALANGVRQVNEQFGKDIELSAEDVEGIVYLRINGLTWEDRVWEWYDTGGGVSEIMRIADTEAHRIGNTAAVDTAKRSGATTKRWRTMLDDRVRETHQYLESVSVPIDADFYTFDGDHAQAPGMFQKVENNANCRCELSFS